MTNRKFNKKPLYAPNGSQCSARKEATISAATPFIMYNPYFVYFGAIFSFVRWYMPKKIKAMPANFENIKKLIIPKTIHEAFITF